MVVGPYPPPIHGASRIAAQVVEGAESRGRVVHVTSTSVQGRLYHVRRALKNARFVVTLVRLRRGSDVRVYQTGAGGPAIYYQAAIALVARWCRVPQAFHHHSFAYLNTPSRAMRWLIAAGGQNLLHIALCDRMAELLRSQYRCRRIATFSNAIFLGPASSGERPAEGEFVIGHLSNLGADKGLDVVLETIDELRGAGVAVRLVLGGPVTDQATQERVQAFMRRGAGRDKWTGYVDPSDVADFMSGLDCFMFPSRYRNEAAPLVVLEALRAGTPVLSSDAGCLREMLDGSGWITAPDSGAMANAVQDLMAQKDGRQMAENIYRRQCDRGRLDEFFDLVAG